MKGQRTLLLRLREHDFYCYFHQKLRISQNVSAKLSWIKKQLKKV